MKNAKRQHAEDRRDRAIDLRMVLGDGEALVKYLEDLVRDE